MPDVDYSSPEIVEAERQEQIRFFQGFAFFKLMGIELAGIHPGRARLKMAWRPDLVQPAGILHGGAIASLIDTAIAHSILLTPQHLEGKAQGGRIVTIDLRVKYLRPVSSGFVFCDARVHRMGRQIIHADATVTDEAGKEVALGDSIYMMVAAAQLRRNT